MFALRNDYDFAQFEHCEIDHVRDDKKTAVCIDQFDCQEFNENEAGWIRNDLSALARSTSQAQYDSIMKRLVEIKQQGGIPEGTPLKDAVAMIKPRWAQSPNEIEQFIEMSNGDVMARLNEAYEKSLKDVKVDTDAPAESPSDSK